LKENIISIRNCFLFDENSTLTQNKYILEIVKSRLFYLCPQGMTLEQIYEYFISEVKIEFTYEEISTAITIENGIKIEQNGEIYSLTTAGFNEVVSAKKDNKLSAYIKLFISENHITSFEYETLQELFLHYIYEKFNQNFYSIYQIINNHIVFNENSRIYKDDEKIAINMFLSWDYPGKNKCIYQIINKAYDYCCITTNNDENFCIDLDEWTFYLDTNIFFRLAGFNHDPGRDLLHRFVKVGRDLNLKLKYSNFTKAEIYKAIERQISYIKEICGEYSLINPEQFVNFTPPDFSIEFYTIFYKWSYRNNNTINYDIFTSHVYDIMNNILQDFEEDNDGISYFTDNKGYDNNALFNSMHTEIPLKSANAIKTDVNNILYIKDKNRENKNEKFCLITVDTKIISWSTKSFIGSNIAELPIVWLTILLKYKGRASSRDYEAFCNFISLPIFVQNNSKLEDRLEVLACAQAFISDASLKDKALRELNNHHTMYKKFDTPEKKVEAAIDNLYEQDLQTYKQASEKNYQDQLGVVIKEHSKEFEELKEAYAQLNNKFIILEENDETNNAIRIDTISTQAKNKAPGQNFLYKIIFSTIFLLLIGAIVICSISIFKSTKTELWQPVELLIEGSFALTLFIIETLLYNDCFLRFNENKIIGRNILKLGKKANITLESLNKYCMENRFE